MTVQLTTDADGAGWLAMSVAYFLETGDKNRLRKDYGVFVRSPACDPDLKPILAQAKQARRKTWRMP